MSTEGQLQAIREEKAAKQRREITFSEDEDEYEYEVDDQDDGGPSGSYDSDYDQIPDKTQAAITLQNERYIKSGYLLKKGEKRRTWKRRWFVLRGSMLAYYKDDKEYQILRIIDLREVHAVAEVRHKSKQHVFGIVTPKRTYYVQTDTKSVLDGWVKVLLQTKKEFEDEETDAEQVGDEEVAKEVIKQYEARRTSLQGLEKSTNRPSATTSTVGPTRANSGGSTGVSVSPKLTPTVPAMQQSSPISILKNKPITILPLSPNISDTAALSTSPQSVHFPSGISSQSQPLEIPHKSTRQTTHLGSNTADYFSVSYNSTSTNVTSPGSALSATADPGFLSSDMGVSSEEDECVSEDVLKAHAVVELEGERDKTLMAGWLLKLGRTKTWKKRWFVLRVGGLVYYKNEKEYAPHRVIPLTTIVDYLQVDPVSKSKQYCFRIVVPTRQFILCTETESELGDWLDALSVAVRRAAKRHSADGSSVISNGSGLEEYNSNSVGAREERAGITVSSEA